ncbi:MAG: hypothetical protein BJ554DRAFT_4745 [Olpidium bornovanus]|uniref:Uncharacterized protein n=1 Tax=Olpidium bornovanus TaxID=278681 RepID=A0A8H7ZMC2_9FUNG|nr:MAG: hypothetical protein BJ554DRAFT_4745 [Olpidium bornovanus]
MQIIRNRATVARCEELLESSGFAPAPILGSLASGGQAQTGQQANIRKVIDYFVDKVETYQKERKIVCFTADQVDLIKSNNESLELCLPHPNLHIPTRYSEVPAQVAYSRQLLRVVASDLKCKDLGVDARSDVDVLSVS